MPAQDFDLLLEDELKYNGEEETRKEETVIDMCLVPDEVVQFDNADFSRELSRDDMQEISSNTVLSPVVQINHRASVPVQYIRARYPRAQAEHYKQHKLHVHTAKSTWQSTGSYLYMYIWTNKRGRKV